MSTLARTYPPGTIIVQDRATVTLDNLGVHSNRWPYYWPSNAWNATPTDYRTGYPQGKAGYFDAVDAIGTYGWNRTFYPFATCLWNTSSQLGANPLDAFLKSLDWWHERSVKVLWITGIAIESATLNAWGDSLTVGGTNEQRVKDFLVALLTDPTTSPLGYTMATHPALAAVELGNEISLAPATALARMQRIMQKTFDQYRTQPTVYFGPNEQGASRTTPVKDWMYADAVSLAAVSAGDPADDGTGKIMLDYVDGFSQHMYSALDTKTEVHAADNSVSNSQQGVRYGAALAHTLMPYWYGPSAAAGGKWHNTVEPKFPRIWNTESDISGALTAEAADGFRWGQETPEARKSIFLRWFLPVLFSTHDGSGGLGTSFYYLLPGSSEDTTTTLTGSQATVGTDGMARVVLASCGAQGAGPYDDIVIYGGASGWPELGIDALGYKRFIGESVSGTTFDLQGTSISATTAAPADHAVYHTRWLFIDFSTWIWFSELIRSGKVTFGYVYHPKAAVTDAPNLGIFLHVEGSRPLYTDATGALTVW